jgi:DNA-directed RNA polymerase subunit RPC12/RpoP
MEVVEAEISRSIWTPIEAYRGSSKRASQYPLRKGFGRSSRRMPIHHMLYRCPRCGHDPLDGHKVIAKCSSCGTQFEQGRGAVIIVRPPDGPPEQCTAGSLLADVERLGGPGLAEPDLGAQLGEDSLFREARITFGRAEGHDVIRWRGEVLGFSERISWKGRGTVRLEGEALTFEPDQGTGRGRSSRGGQDSMDVLGQSFSCLLGDIRGVQISSRALQVMLDGGLLYQFEFVDDSPKRWEDLVCIALTRLYARSGQCITEFKPRIVLESVR